MTPRVTDSEPTYFKYLNGDEATHARGFRWPLPAVKDGKWVAGSPVAVAGTLVPCERGLHLCRVIDLTQWSGSDLYVAQYRGERVDCAAKIVVREARLVAKVETITDRTWRHFACDCAEHVLPLFTARYPNDNRPADAIRIARLFADGKVTAAARAAAWAAARDATWDAERTWKATRLV